MALRTLYLQAMLSINGRNALNGRVLYDRFNQVSEETLLGHLVLEDEHVEGIKDPKIKSDMISYTLLQQFHPNIVYSEDGLFESNDGTWKFPEAIAMEFCQKGGVFVVADVDVNRLSQNKAHYRKAGEFFRSVARYGNGDDREPVYGCDQRRFWKGHLQILCDPAKMVIDEWVRPIYDGVPEILVGIPGCLSYYESLIASCNSDTTGTLHRDRWVDEIDCCPFAAAAQIGSGFAVLIGGRVSGDAWLQGCKHNTTWLTNLAAFLADSAASDVSRRRSYLRSPHLLFLSHRSVDKPTVSSVAKTIKRKGLNVWFDEERLIPSQSLTAEISQALGKMTHFVLFWSSNCLGAPWVERELNSAIALLIERAIPLIIVRLDKTPVPSIIADVFRIEALDTNPELIGGIVIDAVDRLSRSARV
jgi:TIR domain